MLISVVYCYAHDSTIPGRQKEKKKLHETHKYKSVDDGNELFFLRVKAYELTD